MKRYYYDLHIHSCLSTCADDDNTPNNIAGMASLCELDIVALTDHNTTKNCPAFFAAAQKYGLIPIAGMELTTSEDIHVVCLFDTLAAAMDFDKYLQTKRTLIKNRADIFGNQRILDESDEIVSEEEHLLSNATALSVEEVCEVVSSHGGICYPAHIDRDSNGIIAILGTIPKNCDFHFFELRDKDRLEEYSHRYTINKDRFIISSDAHYLTDMRDKENYFTLQEGDADAVRAELFDLFRRKL